MAESDSSEPQQNPNTPQLTNAVSIRKTTTLDEIKAFDSVTEGLLSLDAYKRSKNKSHLNEARHAFYDAMGKVSGGDPIYSRAKYFLAMVDYLVASKVEPGAPLNPAKEERFEPNTTSKTDDWSAYDAEVSYNAGAAQFEKNEFKTSAEHFEKARSAPKASREVRLLSTAGAALANAKKVTTSKEEQPEARAKAASFAFKVKLEVFLLNWLRPFWGASHVELALCTKAYSLTEKARKELRSIV